MRIRVGDQVRWHTYGRENTGVVVEIIPLNTTRSLHEPGDLVVQVGEKKIVLNPERVIQTA